MLCSLPRLRSVVEISYGCMGRSARQPSTASARGLETRRRDISINHTPTIAFSSDEAGSTFKCPLADGRHTLMVQATEYSEASIRARAVVGVPAAARFRGGVRARRAT